MKQITPSKANKEEIVADFIKKLEECKTNTGKFTYTADLEKIKFAQKQVILFTPEAYLKMLTLVNNSSKEIGWHGVISVKDNKKVRVFTVEDILVFPQTVTGVTVQTDDTEYAQWLMKFDTPTYNKIRMQGHSHVNMSTTPSCTDLTYYQNILDTLGDDDYYIFMIINKKMDMTILIYDYANNIIFETKDVNMSVGTKDLLYNNWYNEEIKKVSEPKIQTYNRGNGASWYNQGYYEEDYWKPNNRR